MNTGTVKWSRFGHSACFTKRHSPMQYLGNRSLLDLPKVGFLAASHVPASEVLRCYDWAVEQSRGELCIVGGFSSPMERDVLHFLLKGTCPIVVVLARRMYKTPPDEWMAALDAGRMLVISASEAVRQSRQTAKVRNQYVADLSDTLYLAGAAGGSSIRGVVHPRIVAVGGEEVIGGDRRQ